MHRKYDVEIRTYLTAHDGPHLEWAIVGVELDGQTAFEDSGQATWGPGKALVPSDLGRALSLATRRYLRAVYEASIAAADDAG